MTLPRRLQKVPSRPRSVVELARDVAVDVVDEQRQLVGLVVGRAEVVKVVALGVVGVEADRLVEGERLAEDAVDDGAAGRIRPQPELAEERPDRHLVDQVGHVPPLPMPHLRLPVERAHPGRVTRYRPGRAAVAGRGGARIHATGRCRGR
jgi:hypothetical protein